MANLDATTVNTATTSNEDKPSHYANVFIGTGLDEDNEVIFEQLGRFGVGLDAKRDTDRALIELFESCPDDVQELHVVLQVKSAQKKKPVTKKLVLRKEQ